MLKLFLRLYNLVIKKRLIRNGISPKMNIVIVGGGIGGLTTALMANRMGYKPTVVQVRERLDLPSFGGGIGLWPQSQMVMERLGLLTQLEQQGFYMPDPEYLSYSGKILAHPLKGFQTRYKILTLQRNDLSRILLNQCQKIGVQILPKTLFEDFDLGPDHVKVKLSNEKVLVADNLIGADGINSLVRSKMLQIMGQKPVQPHHCEYVYFRAVVDLSKQPQLLEKFQTTAFESWGEGKRFGYVPLKSPKTFWFAAIPIGQGGLQKFQGSNILTPEKKQWLLKQFSHWKGKIDIKKLIQISEPETILRTDIRKMQGVTKFPWATKDGKVILLGDAANATAPNIAQGAGLAIQSAWDMFSMIDFRNKSEGLEGYLQHRKKRAYTVQSIADTIAFVGQLRKPWSSIRDKTMQFTTYMFPSVETRVFQAVVRYSTGGNFAQKHWLPFLNTKNAFYNNVREENCLLGSIIGGREFNKIPSFVRKFKSSLISTGKGKVTISKVNFIGKLIGLPPNMENQNFGGYIDTQFENNRNKMQKWTRVFGQGGKKAVKYATLHRAGVDYSSQLTGLSLTESLGIGLDFIRLGYQTTVEGNKIHCKTKSIWLKDLNFNLPQMLLPDSHWTEQIKEKSWNFHGSISLPAILGGKVMMEYKGTFQPELKVETERKRKVVIAGGSGMIGSIVCKQFYKKGWRVDVISRNRIKTMNELPFVTVHKWNPQKGSSLENISVLKHCLEDSDVIINLAGQNPGEGPWTDQIKKKILDSRLNSINVLCDGLKQCPIKQRVFIQASAAGIYGNRNNTILDDNAQPSQQKTFRVECCKKIQQGIKSKLPEAIVTRFGHVFSSEDGLYPHIELAAKLGIKNFGLGEERWAPWVHIEDVAGAILHCVENKDIFKGRQVNVASPEHHTYSQILHGLCDIKNISHFRRLPIPESLLKVFLGEMSSVLLQSQRMNPRLLMQTGYEFKHPQFYSAMCTKECL